MKSSSSATGAPSLMLLFLGFDMRVKGRVRDFQRSSSKECDRR